MRPSHLPLTVVIFGPPGSGKGTQAVFITRDFALPHVSTGDMLRAEAASGSALGGEVAPLIAAGRLVDDTLIVRVIEHRMRHPDVGAGVVLDGFPRTVVQALALDAMLGAAGRRVDLVISLVVPVEEIVERLQGRVQGEARADDSREVIPVRMTEYEAKTVPVLDHYRAHGANVVAVDGVGAIEAVRHRIHAEVAAALGRDSVTLTGRAEARRAGLTRTES